MKIVARNANQITVLDVSGPIVFGEAAEDFLLQIRELLKAGTRTLALNFAQVPYVDSAGVGALFAAYTAAHEAGAKCKLFGAPPAVSHVLERAHLDKILEMFGDEASAVSSF